MQRIAKGLQHILTNLQVAELVLIAKSETFINNHHPKLIIEPHFINNKVNTEDVISRFGKYGFKDELIKQDELHLPLIFAY